jgi:heme oxygenase
MYDSRLIDLYNEYRDKYDDFPIVTYNLTEEQQESLIDVVESALSNNREITKEEIDQFQPDTDGLDF